MPQHHGPALLVRASSRFPQSWGPSRSGFSPRVPGSCLQRSSWRLAAAVPVAVQGTVQGAVSVLLMALFVTRFPSSLQAWSQASTVVSGCFLAFIR
ncbi:hypothetical protein HPB52_017784 [Rhipicephalus sanguineus]|uniref:Uncharacterized protein n=1 Tax=Rhipicephalus sanguineus TaxID=34632 RepID=A0A9D4QBI2_RHISA|nr:hypothetical protein HPB52_017784 [Rhipicephalus sanguineus]